MPLKNSFRHAIKHGVKHPLVERYLQRLLEFAKTGIDKESLPIFDILQKKLDHKESTSDIILKTFGHGNKIDKRQATNVVNFSIEDENRVLKEFNQFFPETSHELDKR